MQVAFGIGLPSANVLRGGNLFERFSQACCVEDAFDFVPKGSGDDGEPVGPRGGNDELDDPGIDDAGGLELPEQERGFSFHHAADDRRGCRTAAP